MKPYYQDEWVTIYHGDCREILPELPKVDLVLTDPPYPSQHLEYGNSDIKFLKVLECLQLVFWSARDNFPLDYTAIHIWDKNCGTITTYERIFERNGQTNYKLFRDQPPRTRVMAQMVRDVVTGHPSQKPQKVVSRLVADYSNVDNLILDPFLGSGTTAYCAKKLNRKCIGIEIEEKYCEIAANRCRQSVMTLNI
tara:strand:+ start:70 stop:654 length:585 start_codon:yes stop_codon:yes gene_type:complete